MGAKVGGLLPTSQLAAHPAHLPATRISPQVPRRPSCHLPLFSQALTAALKEMTSSSQASLGCVALKMSSTPHSSGHARALRFQLHKSPNTTNHPQPTPMCQSRLRADGIGHGEQSQTWQERLSVSGAAGDSGGRKKAGGWGGGIREGEGGGKLGGGGG